MTEKQQKAKDQVLVIGAGMAGIEASLTLAAADKKVYLVEKEPLFGGKIIKFEEVFANIEFHHMYGSAETAGSASE